MTDSKVPAGSNSEVWVIDQITSGVASVERDGGSTTTVPATILPRGAAEGDVLRVTISPGNGSNNITISLDPAEKARRLERSAAQVAKGGKGGKGNIVL